MFWRSETAPSPEIIRIPPPPVEFTLAKAIRYITGYCNKHPRCEDGCKLYDEDQGGCKIRGTSPCNWDEIEKELTKEAK